MRTNDDGTALKWIDCSLFATLCELFRFKMTEGLTVLIRPTGVDSLKSISAAKPNPVQTSKYIFSLADTLLRNQQGCQNMVMWCGVRLTEENPQNRFGIWKALPFWQKCIPLCTLTKHVEICIYIVGRQSYRRAKDITHASWPVVYVFYSAAYIYIYIYISPADLIWSGVNWPEIQSGIRFARRWLNSMS